MNVIDIKNLLRVIFQNVLAFRRVQFVFFEILYNYLFII